MVDYNGTLIITKIQNVVTLDTVVYQCCFYGSYCMTLEDLEFFNKNLVACLHEVTSSLRLFSVPRWGLQIIKYFSHRHKLHLLEQGLYEIACSNIRGLAPERFTCKPRYIQAFGPTNLLTSLCKE